MTIGATHLARAVRLRRAAPGFTLIELLLVMTLLAIVLALSAPTLSRFFHSRSLDSEARRFMSLTRAAQVRAVAEGVPIVVWLETKQHTYGINADKSFIENDPKAEQFSMDASIEIEAQQSATATAAAQASVFKSDKQTSGSLFMLRFNPDGFVSPGSPETVVFRQQNNGELLVAQSRNRLNYEIQVGKQTAAR